MYNNIKLWGVTPQFTRRFDELNARENREGASYEETVDPPAVSDH